MAQCAFQTRLLDQGSRAALSRVCCINTLLQLTGRGDSRKGHGSMRLSNAYASCATLAVVCSFTTWLLLAGSSRTTDIWLNALDNTSGCLRVTCSDARGSQVAATHWLRINVHSMRLLDRAHAAMIVGSLLQCEGATHIQALPALAACCFSTWLLLKGGGVAMAQRNAQIKRI